MAEAICHEPMRLPMVTKATVVKAILVAGATEAGGQHSLLLAIVAGGFVLTGSIVGPILTVLVQQRNRPSTDVTAPQAELLNQVIDHLATELAAEKAAHAEKAAEVERLKRRRRG